jgi:hypothetical protein
LRHWKRWAVSRLPGAGNWHIDLNKYFVGREVFIVPDADDAGEKRITRLYEELKEVASSIKVVRLPGLEFKDKHGEDITDWLGPKHGHTNEEFIELARNALEFKQEPAKLRGYPTEVIDHASIGLTKEWLVKGLFAKGEHSRWIAHPKMMKSALLASAANHMASAQPDWRGFKIKRKVGVLYCALERPELTKRRLIAEQQLMGLSDLPIKLCRARFSLASNPDVEQLIATINEASEELQHQVEFVIIDTSAKLIAAHGGDEQQAKDNALVWGNLSDVRAATGVHTAVIGHLGKDASKGERGSNSSLGDADFVASISGDDVKTATVTDANDMAAGDLFTFTGRKFSFGVDEDGDENNVYIVDPEPAAGSIQPSASDEPNLSSNQKTFFSILHAAAGAGLTLEEWNAKAREAGLGASRKANLFDYRSALLGKDLVREYGGRWRVNHS